MSKAIDDLKHEHEAILTALQILDEMVRKLESRADVAKADIAGFIGFLKEFADKCHHGKEEGILFPALAAAGIPEEGGPIGVMLSEHTEGRAAIKGMEAALSGAPDYPRFIKSAKEYSELLKNHIQKENNVLFPMAEQALTQPQLADIYQSFEGHEEKVMGKGRHEELHAMLKTLRARYLTR